ncbi:hypothetical protein FALBO_1139 [Fusarium albosuccineum]|uniref:Uncharacterized protein n=1 Tax=Fusarium albosuccineum TaxID=1237068 RepID=A0A8H4LLU9_9HYPO|nr:hypothetical protein FALBO_1139 [Fusarium albosuccineum]
MAGRSNTTNNPIEDGDGGVYRLYDMSSSNLDQLTELLWMDPAINVASPDEEWLTDQESRIATLGEPLRRSTKLLDRIVARLSTYRDAPQTAHLCAAHHGLDPKLIRRLMFLIITECTERTERFRVWRRRIAFPDTVIAWLDRVDALTSMWIGRNAFRAVFGYQRTSTSGLRVESGCEACIMSVVGGRPQLLSDLRACMIARRGKYPRTSRKEPRLLRLVESWINHLDADCSRAVVDASESLASEIINLVQDIDRRKEEREKLRNDGKRSSRGGHSKKKNKGEKKQNRKEKKSDRRNNEPQQPSHEQRSNPGLLINRERNNNPQREVRDADEPIAPNVVDAVQTQEDEEAPAVEHEAHETSRWMNDRMENQGLTAEERRQLFEDDMHPAFSDYGARSAVPAPLNFQREAQPAPTIAETIWEPVSVRSYTGSQAPSLYPRHDTLSQTRDNDLESLPPVEGDDQYLAFCNRWGISPNPVWYPPESATSPLEDRAQQDTEPHPFRPPSSVYSSHAGFRRSQDHSGWARPQEEPSFPQRQENTGREEIVFRDPFENGGRRSRRRTSARSAFSTRSTRSTRSSNVSPMGRRHRMNVNIGIEGTVWDELRERREEE